MMVAATLTLTNCNKVSSIEEPAAKLFTIRANTGADSKTTNDGMHTLWAENDKVSLLYAPAGTNVTSEFTNVPMTIASGAGTSSAVFKGEATLSGSNDFYAIYPHSGALKIPGQRNSGYIFVGNKNGVTQNGYDSMAHLSGSNCPMYGVALDNDDETIPEFTMKQLASVIELSIRSYSNEDFILKKVELLASEDIVGSYYIDITGTNPVYTPSGANYVSNTAVVNIENGAAVSKGSTIKVYIPIKPYVQAEGTVLHFVYTATVGGVTMTTTDDIGASTDVAKRTFHAGKIKRVSSSILGFWAASTYTLSDLVSAVTGTEHDFTTTESYTVENARVMAKNNSNVILEDDTDIMLYYGSNSGINVGDVVTVSGNVKNHYYTAEIVSGSLTKTDTFTPDYSTPSSFDAAAFKAAYDAHQVVDINLVTFTGTVDAEGKYVSIDGTTLKSSVYGISATLKGKDVTVVGYPVGVGSAANGNPINFVPVSVEERGGVTPPTPQTTTISSLLAVASSLQDGNTSSESYTVENAKVMAINGGNVIVSDATGTILYYENNLNGINAGDVVTMTGRVQNYHFLPEVTSGSLTKTGSFTPDYSSPLTNFNSDSYLATKEAKTMLSIDLIKIEGTFNENASVFTVDGQTVTYTVFDQTANANKTCVVVGYPVGMSNSSKVKILPVTVTPKSSPAVVVSPSELSWGATETSTKTVTVVCGNDWTVTGAPTWLTVTKVDATSFTVTPTANTGAARNATLTVTNSANSSYTATVSVSQGSALDKTYLWTTAAGQVTAAAGSVTVSNVKWDFSAATYIGFESANSARGLQIGSSNKPQTSEWTLSTDQISGTIKSVKVNACTGGSATLSISVGGVSYLSATSLTSTTTAYTGTGSSSGTIVITMQAGTKAMYIKSIEIVYN